MHDKLVKFFLRFQCNVKLYHWCTVSYARHKASDELFAKLNDLADKFLEVYFGKYGRPSVSEDKHMEIRVSKITDEEMTCYLKAVKIYLTTTLMLKLNIQDDSDLINLKDELLEHINQTLYLFGCN